MKAAKTLSLGMILATAALGWPGQLGGQTKIEFEGNITAVSGTQIELFNGAVHFEARGARIETDDEEITNISDLKIGTAIEVEALLGAGDSIQATTLEVSDEKDQDSEVCGVIGIVDEAARTFTIGPISISWTGQTKFKEIPAPAAGKFVEVSLQVSGDRLVALEVEREEADD